MRDLVRDLVPKFAEVLARARHYECCSAKQRLLRVSRQLRARPFGGGIDALLADPIPHPVPERLIRVLQLLKVRGEPRKEEEAEKVGPHVPRLIVPLKDRGHCLAEGVAAAVAGADVGVRVEVAHRLGGEL
eukprot:scaffold132177_cov37-Tisochrysis_lutea.AAC.1